VGGIPRRPRQNPRRYRSPQEHDLPFESHKITCSDGVMIHAWLILQPQPTTSTVPTILFFHGNAGNIGLRLPNAVQMYQHLKCNILMVEYRGYGDSDSVAPSEAGLKLDAEASLRFALDHALSRFDPNICLWSIVGWCCGLSFGTVCGTGIPWNWQV
jgi:pimeloyl-ACP methyl ester carboxylesterase